jgi:hypothetical protein
VRPGDPAASEDAFLLRYLQANEVACPSCGYNLHALTHSRCPECGQTIRLKVALRVPPMPAWLVMAAATCASAGLGIVFAAMDAPERFTRAAYLAILFFYAAIPLAAGVLLGRRWIIRRPPTEQRIVATILATLATLAMIRLVTSLF